LSAVLTRLVVDSSAIMACCLGETGFEALESALTRCPQVLMSAPTRLELGMVSQQRGVRARVEKAIETYTIDIMAFDADMAHLAIAAFDKFGKGRHPAALNFGDCCSYALAKSLNLPLLFKGNDFAQTDIPSAVA
jgi:ribonuclease VapC